MALRTVGVRLTAEIGDYQRKMRQAGRDTKDFTAEMDRAARGGQLDAVADQAGVAGLAIGGMAVGVVSLAADFEKSMSSVKAATRASAGELEALRGAALQAGADTSFSATQAADAITELSKAGVSSANILGGGLKGALDLAAAGQLDVGEAAETAASAMTQFKLSGAQVPHIADLLAAAAGKAQGTVHDMGMALNQVGLVAAQTGLSIEDTTGTLAAFASAGLTGSDAGTSFKQMLLMLQAPSDTTKALMEDLGVSAYDASGQFIGITQLAQQLREKLGHLTPELRANAMAQIFGADAVRGATILYEQGAEGIQGWINKTNDAGYAAETAKIQTDNLIGDLERLKGSLQTLAIESGGGANEGLRTLTQGAGALVDQFALLPTGISGTITVLGLLGGALLLGGAGWVKYRSTTAAALEEMRNTGPAGQRAASGLEATTKWAGRAAVAFAGAQVAAAGMTAAFGQDLNPQTDAFSKALADWAEKGTKAGEATRLLGKDFEHLGYDLSTLDSGFWASLGNGISGTVESLTGLGSVMDESLQHARERLQAIDAALASMVSSGQTAQAAAVFGKLADEAKKSGVSVEELKKGLPQYAAAASSAGTASSTTAAQVAEVGKEAQTTEEKIEELEKAFDELFGAQMSVDRATLKYRDGLVELTKELTTGKRTLELNSEEGRKNRSAVLDQIDAIEDLRGSRVKHGMSLDEANKKYVKDIDGLRATLKQAGFTQKQIEDLTGAYRRIPKTVSTDVKTTNTAGVARELEILSQIQQALKKGTALPSGAIGALNKTLRGRTGPQIERAAGGRVFGPGTDTSDDIDARLSRDEYVIKAKSARAIGYDRLDEMNETGQVSHFAAGGRVGWPYPVNAGGTWVPTRDQVAAAVVPALPSSGRTGPWIERMAKMMVPTIRVISGFRPGARTLSGNRSLHALDRARDFNPSKELAEKWDEQFGSRTTEAITPYQQYNRLRGRRHTYTGAVWRQHNFAGGNAHNHIAMEDGGVITEPIFGIGASGATYSLGENYKPERVIPNWQGHNGSGGGGVSTVINLNVALAAGANPREAGRQIAEQLGSYLKGGGSLWIKGQQVLP